MITISSVTRRFGRTAAVNNVSLDIVQGESVALWGANGAGKTTLIRCVLGLFRYQGTITIAGHDALRDGKRARLLIGYVPQELGFYDDLGVAEAVRFFARFKGLSAAETSGALDRVGLSGHEHKRIRELSGGMKQRLALAIALLGDPPILILDEVTASLDAVGRDDFVGLLEQLSGAGRTMLFASHRLEEVGALADRVVMLDRGAVSAIDSRDAFLTRLGRGAVLHLHLPESTRRAAVHTLQSSGFSPTLNGVGVLVPVQPEQKAAPFRVLADARISISDFEIVTAERAASLARHTQSARTQTTSEGGAQ